MINQLPIHRRFASALSLAAAGSFLAVVSRVWGSGTIEWIGVVIGVVAVLGGLALMAAGARGAVERGIDGLTVLLGAWTIVASLAYSGATRLDLALWEGVAFALLGATALFVHEQTTERVVHELEVTHRADRGTPVAH